MSDGPLPARNPLGHLGTHLALPATQGVRMMSPFDLFQLETPERASEAFSPLPRPPQREFDRVVMQRRRLQNATNTQMPFPTAVKARGEEIEERLSAWGWCR